MALFSFPTLQPRKRSQVVAIDLGARSTKAVSVLRRKGEELALVNYTIQPAPNSEKGLTKEILVPHLKAVVQALDTKVKQVVVAIGVNDSILRNVELPMLGRAEMRQVLKHGSKNYLQQDLPNYAFDCHILPTKPAAVSSETGKANQKFKVLVGGAKQEFLDMIQASCKEAGLVADQITLSLLGPPNAFERAMAETFSKDIVALVDIGFRNSTITILQQGELIMNRVVGLGGDKLTSGLAEVMGISYDEAEGIKVGMAEEVQGAMMGLLIPLGRELRASIDFYEHQNDKTVSRIFVSGGSARSKFIVETLQSELIVPCEIWNPVGFLTIAVPPQLFSELEPNAPLLAVAAGAAAAAF